MSRAPKASNGYMVNADNSIPEGSFRSSFAEGSFSMVTFAVNFAKTAGRTCGQPCDTDSTLESHKASEQRRGYLTDRG